MLKKITLPIFNIFFLKAYCTSIFENVSIVFEYIFLKKQHLFVDSN